MKRQIIRIGTLVFIDVVLPLSLYFALRNHINVTAALIISGIPPLLNVIYTFIRKRKIDALGCLFVFSFILSGVLSLVTGNARIALLRESAVTGVLCILFFITNIPITTPWFVNRPLVYLIAQELYSEQPPLRWVDTNRTEQQQPKTEWLWEKYKPFKIYCYVSSLMWSIGLGGEFLSRVLMVECTTLTIDEIVKYGVIIVATISSVLGVITVVSSAMIRKRANEYIDNWMDENDHYELLALNEAETINKD
ncbi:hypothetical protein K501DRAFT_260558 [Backusella circina FSU 941]|nr:hypothetical protein K501DRAFT_260558 [Backusella circina FSU 941]